MATPTTVNFTANGADIYIQYPSSGNPIIRGVLEVIKGGVITVVSDTQQTTTNGPTIDGQDYAVTTFVYNIPVGDYLFTVYDSFGNVFATTSFTVVTSGVTPGATGATGVTGATGITGAVGSTGTTLTGSLGASGSSGSTGVSGLSGLTGATGLTSITGLTGATGLTGITGVTGITGLFGLSGVTGEIGFIGFSGMTGETGQVGEVGVTGVTGLAVAGLIGLTGIPGSTGTTGVTGLAGVMGAIGELSVLGTTGVTGVIGLTGADGVSVRPIQVSPTLTFSSKGQATIVTLTGLPITAKGVVIITSDSQQLGLITATGTSSDSLSVIITTPPPGTYSIVATFIGVVEDLAVTTSGQGYLTYTVEPM